MALTSNVRAKADRLLVEGRVEPDRFLHGVFEVVGDSDTYWPIVVTPTRRFCPCKSHSECSHLTAAIDWVLTEAGPDESRFRGYRDALDRRKAAERAAGEEILRRLS